MTEFPRLELREDPGNKKNDYIIFRYPLKSRQTKKTRKRVYRKSKKRGTRKSFLGIF